METSSPQKSPERVSHLNPLPDHRGARKRQPATIPPVKLELVKMLLNSSIIQSPFHHLSEIEITISAHKDGMRY